MHWITTALEEKHQTIFHLLNSQIGHKIQRIESDIIIKALLMAMDEGIPSLPVHDALIFPKSKKEEGIRIMTTAFKEVTGADGTLKEEL